MAFSRSLAAAFFGLLAFTTSVYADGTGDGTAYSGDGEKDKTGFNACQFGQLDSQWEKYYAALPSDSFNKETDCGRCIAVKGLDSGASGDWVTVMVVDECASCSGGDVDFSTDALKAITGYSWDRKRIQWKWTECDGSSTATASSDSSSSDTSSSKSSSDESPSPSPELEGDLNGDGELSRREKKKLAQSNNRKLLA